MKNKEKFYKKQIKEDILKGSLQSIEKKLKQIEDLKTLNDNADLQDELWIKEMALYHKKNKLTGRLNKLIDADGYKANKLNKKIVKLYIRLDELNHQPQFTGSFYMDVTRLPEINKTQRKISKLTDQVIALGREPATMEYALSTIKNNEKVSTVGKLEIEKAQNAVASTTKSNQNNKNKVPSSEKLYMPVEKSEE